LHCGSRGQGEAASGSLIAGGHQLIKAGPPGPGVAGRGGCESLAGLGLIIIYAIVLQVNAHPYFMDTCFFQLMMSVRCGNERRMC